MRTLLLDQTEWDLVLDANGNIAIASDPYSMAQDAASAIKTFRGECYWDVNVGVPLLQDVLAKDPSPTLIKALFVAAAKTVPGVLSAQCFLSGLEERTLTGQVQIIPADPDLEPSAIDFATINPQGA